MNRFPDKVSALNTFSYLQRILQIARLNEITEEKRHNFALFCTILQGFGAHQASNQTSKLCISKHYGQIISCQG